MGCSTEGAGMSDGLKANLGKFEYPKPEQLLEQAEKIGFLEPNHTVEAINALRAAVVAQTALLRSLSEQIRLGQAATNGALDGLASTIGHFYGDTGEALAGLAERLDKLERKLTSVDEKATLWAAVNPIHFPGKRQQTKRN